MSASLRLVCAEILETLSMREKTIREAWRLQGLKRDAQTLRWVERFEFGDPVPAVEHDDVLSELRDAQQEVGALDDRLDVTQQERDVAFEEMRRLRDMLATYAPNELREYDSSSVKKRKTTVKR